MCASCDADRPLIVIVTFRVRSRPGHLRWLAVRLASAPVRLPARRPVALGRVLQAAIPAAVVGMAEVGIFRPGDRLPTASTGLAGDERRDQLGALALVSRTITSLSRRSSLGIALATGNHLASRASHRPGEVTVEELLTVEAKSLRQGHLTYVWCWQARSALVRLTCR
jgi:hypothetical protein